MAGGYDDAAVAVQRPHGIGERGRGHELLVEMHAHAVGRKHAGRRLGEERGFVAAVVADGDRRICKFFMKIAAIALGRPGDGVDVEPVGARADHAAQPARAKFQVPVETVENCRFIAGNLLQLRL